MGEKKAALAARAWGLLRRTLLWARRGGGFKRGLLSASNFRKGLRGGGGGRGIHDGYQIRHSEKELYLGETPVYRVGSTRPTQRNQESMRIIVSSLLFVNPPTPADLGFKDDVEYASRREAAFRSRNGEIDDRDGEDEFASAEWLVESHEGDEEEEEFALAEREEGPEAAKEQEKGVDARAEEFIARFYQQMKLQRNESLLQYHEMLHRGT